MVRATRTHFAATGTPCLTCQLVEGKHGDFDLDVDPIQQRAGYLRQIAIDLLRRALAITSWMSSKSTKTRVVYLPVTKPSVFRMKHREEEPTHAHCRFYYVIGSVSCAALGLDHSCTKR